MSSPTGSAERVVRAALIQTRNAFAEMPARIEDLHLLSARLDDIREANVAHHAVLIRQAAAAGARIVCLGELFTAPYFALDRDPLWLGLAEDALDGPTARTLGPLARELGVVVIAPLYEHDAATDKRYNTAVVIDADGSVLGRYRKTHIPEGINERAAFHETFYYGRSDAPPYFPVFETAVGTVGVATCYDRHFAGSVASLAHAGARLIFCPAVTFGVQSRRMWDLEFPVDAARQRVFIGGLNRLGTEPPWDVEYFGASYFVGPDGVLPNLSSADELVISDLDLAALDATDGSGWDLRRDARPDIYLS